VTKEGSGKFSGRLRFKASDYFLRTERFNYFGNPKGHLTPRLRNYEATLSGPILKGPVALTYFASGELMDQARGFLPNQQAEELSFQGKLSLRFSPNHKLLLRGLGHRNTWDTFSNYYAKYGPRSEGYPFDRYERVLADSTLERYIFVTDPEHYRDREVAESGYWIASDGRKLYYKRIREFYQAGLLDHRADNTNKSNQQSVVWTHTLSKQTYYEIKLARFFSHFRQAVKDVDDRDKDGNTEEELYWRNNGKLNPDGTLSPLSHRNILDEVGYWNFTGDQGVWMDQKATSWSARLDLTSQITKHHLIKVGTEAAWNQGAVEKATWESVDKVREDIWDQDALDWALYVQDKIEFEGLIVNAGLRFDHFDHNGLRDPVLFPQDLKNLSTADLVSLRGLKKAKRRSQLSPRIGISHPITERDVLHFAYGHFFQRPDARYLYENIGLNTSYATNIDFGNPNLKPEKTVSYEIGLNHLFTPDIKGSVTAYFKDITNLVDQAAYLTTDGYLVYEAFANADYANARGLEFSLEKRVGPFWGGTVNYAWAFAKGRSSSAFAAGTDLIPRRLDPLSWDVRHRVNANLIVRTPSRLGRWLGDWYFDTVYQFATGTPYSSSAGKGVFVLLAPRNDARLPSRHRVDLRARKRFAVMSLNPTLFIETLNLLNRRNVDYISDVDYYERTGDPSGFFKNPDVYSNPRTVRFGVELYW